jgi:hydroxymethylpyrimidine/phosphomethylpyrimidine kinase
MQPKTYTTVLTIAGSDPSGGAGIQADLKTFSALSCYGMSVITALTAQNTQGVTAVYPIPAKFITEQLDAIFADIKVDAIKIGMLHDVDVIKTVANKIKSLTMHIVLDPVMVAKNGHTLLKNRAIKALQKNLFPLATIITPNIPEAELLLEQKIKTQKKMQQAAKALCENGLKAVLIKGGHLENTKQSADCLYIKATDNFHWLTDKRIKTKNTHGTGCTLSSAIASFLALGYDLLDAVTQAKKYLSQAILLGSEYSLGKGHGPLYFNCQNSKFGVYSK